LLNRESLCFSPWSVFWSVFCVWLCSVVTPWAHIEAFLILIPLEESHDKWQNPRSLKITPLSSSPLSRCAVSPAAFPQPGLRGGKVYRRAAARRRARGESSSGWGDCWGWGGQPCRWWSQNPSMVGVGRDLCGVTQPNPLPKQGHAAWPREGGSKRCCEVRSLAWNWGPDGSSQENSCLWSELNSETGKWKWWKYTFLKKWWFGGFWSPAEPRAGSLLAAVASPRVTAPCGDVLPVSAVPSQPGLPAASCCSILPSFLERQGLTVRVVGSCEPSWERTHRGFVLRAERLRSGGAACLISTGCFQVKIHRALCLLGRDSETSVSVCPWLAELGFRLPAGKPAVLPGLP